MSWTNSTKPETSFGNQAKPSFIGLATEDLLNFLTTEDDEILLVEPVAGGGLIWNNQEKI